MPPVSQPCIVNAFTTAAQKLDHLFLSIPGFLWLF